MTNRTRGTLLTPVDFTALAPEVLDFVNKDREEPFTSVTTNYDWALGIGSGKTWLICSEGVAYPVTDEGVTIEWYGRTEASEGKGGSFSIFPNAQTRLDETDVVEVYAQPEAEKVDLADFVRTFGARLETNFSILHRTLNH